MKIPFNYTFKGLLLSGQAREIAQIEYEMPDGFEKELALLNINYSTEELQKLSEYKIKKLELQKKFNKIDEFNYEFELLKINNENKPETERLINEIDLKHKYKKIDDVEYCKQKNDLLGKPWVAIHTEYDENANPDDLMVEVTYNKTFIENMRKKGLPGDTEEEIAEQWLKLFLMANMDIDDITTMLDDNEVEEKKYLTKRKIDDKTIIMG